MYEINEPRLRGNSFAERLQSAMAHHGFSQSDLAKKISVATSTMNLWFHGMRGIRGAHLMRLSDALGVCPDWLNSGVGPIWRSQERAMHMKVKYDTPEGWRWVPYFSQTAPILHWLKSKDPAKDRLKHLEAAFLMVPEYCGDNLGLNRLDMTISKTFALDVFDMALSPEFLPGDRLLFEAPQNLSFQVKPSDLVLATVGELQTAEIVLRQYRRVGFEMDDYAKKEHFELVASNPDYPSFSSKQYRIKILAVAFELHKNLKK